MDKYVIAELKKEHEGEIYKFPLGCKAENVETDEDHEFWTPEKQADLKKIIETINKALGGKANILTVSRTVYVSDAGSDESGDGTEEAPYRSIQHALENVPVINGNYEYTISIGSGTYEGFIAKNVSATIELNGDITISDSKTYPIEIDDSNVKINGNDHVINIVGDGGGALFYIHNGGRLNAYKAILKLAGSGVERGIYIVSDGGFSQTNARMSFENLDTAIQVGTNSVFYSDALYGTVNNGIVATNGGRVAYETNNMTATTPLTTSSGGRVNSGSQDA